MEKRMAVVFTRNGKPDMRIIHKDMKDNYAKVVGHIAKEYAGKEIVIVGMKDYDSDDKWLSTQLKKEIDVKEIKYPFPDAKIIREMKFSKMKPRKTVLVGMHRTEDLKA